jgi:ribosomal protein L37E
MKLRVLTCQRCGKKFETYQPNVKYCTACRGAVQRDRVRAYHAAHKTPASKLAAAPLCRRGDCRWFCVNTGTCDYRLKTYTPRGCDIDGCVRYYPEAGREGGEGFGDLIFMDC